MTTSQFVISRTFDAPPAELFQAWTDPERMQRWWGPKGTSVVQAEMDLRPGGTYHYCLRTSDGKDMWGKFIYREVTPPKRLVWVNTFSDAKGGITRHPFKDSWPMELLTTVTFDDQGGKTEVTIRWEPINPTPAEKAAFDNCHDSMQMGWGGTLDQLTEYVGKAAA